MTTLTVDNYMDKCKKNGHAMSAIIIAGDLRRSKCKHKGCKCEVFFDGCYELIAFGSALVLECKNYTKGNWTNSKSLSTKSIKNYSLFYDKKKRKAKNDEVD